MNQEFLPAELEQRLRAIGFDEPVLGDTTMFQYKGNFIQSNGGILYQQAFRWFREKYKLRVGFDSYAPDEPNVFEYIYQIKSGDGFDAHPFFSGNFSTFEECQDGAILKCIKMVEKIKQQTGGGKKFFEDSSGSMSVKKECDHSNTKKGWNAHQPDICLDCGEDL